jgi:hypothetical protein
MIIFGGIEPSQPSLHTNDVWSLDLTPGMEQWSELTPSGSAPEPGESRTAVYDEANQRMIVYGGYRCYDFFGDVQCDFPTNKAWELDLPSGNESWRELDPYPTPTGGGRCGHTAIYDAPNHRMVVFGGKKVTYWNPPNRDVWALDLTPGAERWCQVMPPSPTPRSVWGHAAVHFPIIRWMLTFGGYTGAGPSYGDPLDQTWVLDTSSPDDGIWVDLSSPGPPARGSHSLVYDSRNQRALLFGGRSGVVLFDDVWLLDSQEEPPSWQELTFSPPIPQARSEHTAIYDPVSHRMVIFGGLIGPVGQPSFVNETWVLTLP